MVHDDDKRLPDYPYPRRIWILFNEIYGVDTGMDASYGDDIHIVGNLIHDIQATTPLLVNSAYSPGAAIKSRSPQKVSIVNNVIYNTDLGILGAGYAAGSQFDIVNNIVLNLTDNYWNQFGEDPFQIFLESTVMGLNSSMSHNLLYQNGGPIRIRWLGGTQSEYASIVDFQIGTGKGEGCLQQDPNFVDPANLDFHLQVGSPAVDGGTEAGVYGLFETLYPGQSIRLDSTGNPRPQGSEWDLGIFESGPPAFAGAGSEKGRELVHHDIRASILTD